LLATLSSDSSRSISLVPDALLYKWTGGVGYWGLEDRLRGFAATNTNSARVLKTNSTAAEATEFPIAAAIQNTSWIDGAAISGVQSITYNLRRAPGFFDVVCYTGNGSTQNVTHNLGVVPELMIIKERNGSTDWRVYIGSQGNQWTSYLNLTYQGDSGTSTWNSTTPTASVFSLGVGNSTNGAGDTYVNYLFASCPGVSKVGSYTGNGSSQTINCGFTGGSRFVLIKRTNASGDWVVFDSARGIVAGNDPALYLNSSAAEVTTIDAVDTDNSGFIVNQDATLNLNVNAATYIFLAIA
jgi:hypothetical protein